MKLRHSSVPLLAVMTLAFAGYAIAEDPTHDSESSYKDCKIIGVDGKVNQTKKEGEAVS